jgi:hypothetical protein
MQGSSGRVCGHDSIHLDWVRNHPFQSRAILGFMTRALKRQYFRPVVIIAFGFSISVLAYTIAPISGGRINSAVTFAFVLLENMTPTVGISYLLDCPIQWSAFGSCYYCMGGYGFKYVGKIGTLFDWNEQCGADDLPLASAFLAEGMGIFVLVPHDCGL